MNFNYNFFKFFPETIIDGEDLKYLFRTKNKYVFGNVIATECDKDSKFWNDNSVWLKNSNNEVVFLALLAHLKKMDKGEICKIRGDKNYCIKNIYEEVKKITQPSLRSKYEIILEELMLDPIIPKNFEIFKCKWCKIDLPSSVLIDLKNGILEKYFGSYVEKLLAFALLNHVEEVNEVKYKNNLYSNELDYVYLKNKVLKQNFINTEENKLEKFKSIYHYVAFITYLEQIEKNKNIVLLTDSYLKLVARLNTYMIDFLDNYIQKFKESDIDKIFGNNLEYQKEIRKDDLHGFMDFNNDETVIEIKTSSKNLIENEFTIEMKNWFKQLEIYNYMCENKYNKYVIFNPISNIICVWEK